MCWTREAGKQGSRKTPDMGLLIWVLGDAQVATAEAAGPHPSLVP